MTSRQIRGLSFLLLLISLSGCSTLAKQDTTAVPPAPVTTAPLVPVATPEPEPVFDEDDGTVTVIIQVDPPTIAELNTPELSDRFKADTDTKKKKKSKKVKKR